MSLAIEHNGRELRFREDDETWSCREMNMTAKSLRALKTKLDRFDGQARKVSLAVLVVGQHDERASPAQIVMLAKPKDWETDYGARTGGQYAKVPAVWITTISGNKVERAKVKLDRCVTPTPENLEALAVAQAKFAEAKRITLEAKQIIADLPRLSAEGLMAQGVSEDDAPEG